MELLQIARMTEEEARLFLEKVRWPNGPVCPHCGSLNNSAHLEGSKHRPGVYKCRDCRQQYTVTVNTIMHRSKVSLDKWLLAFHLMCSSKKGISALQLQRELGLGSYQTAWHMEHRIRYAMNQGGLTATLSGDVEVDETYVGGKPRKGGEKSKRGRGTKKQPVLLAVEREGRARTRVVPDVTSATLSGAVREWAVPDSRIITDELGSYKGIEKYFPKGGHLTVNHSRGEYVRGDACTNTAESFFALLKRGVVGTFHSVSKQHLDLYADEFEFRWNHRKCSDYDRMLVAIEQVGGKRLTYRALTGTDI